VATAALEFIPGPLLDNPHRVGGELRGRYQAQRSARCGGEHRIRYEIDEQLRTVVVLDVSRRADAYGTP
jgi:mRNA-degrading endonuclease RelE of RelBE toxin-antitoxin system